MPEPSDHVSIGCAYTEEGKQLLERIDALAQDRKPAIASGQQHENEYEHDDDCESESEHEHEHEHESCLAEA